MKFLRLIPAWFALLIAFSIGAWVYTICPPSASVESGSTDSSITLGGYMWLDSLPEDTYTPFNLYMFAEGDGGWGVNIQAESSFKLGVELFEYIENSAEKRIQFRFPHDGRKPVTPYTIEKMSRPTSYFTHQLTIAQDPQNKGKKTTYYTGPDFALDSQMENVPAHLRPALRQACNLRPDVR